MKTLVLVLACRTPPYPALVESIKRTWASVPVDDVETVFYHGGDEFAVVGPDLYLPVPDDLSHVGHKTIACFEYALAHCEFDLVFRTNCSTYVDLPNLRGFACEEGEDARFYAGKGSNHDSIDFASGSGYFLSRDLVQLVVEKQAEWDHHYLDDVALGKLLRGDAIERKFVPRVDVGTPREAKRIDLSQFQFRCKTDSAGRRGDIEIMSTIHAEFGRARGSVAAANRIPARVIRHPSDRGQASRPRRAADRMAWRAARSRLRRQIGTTVRRAPGGTALWWKRYAAVVASRRPRALRPPLESPQQVAWLSATPADESFITGNGIAARCRYVLNYDALAVNKDVANDWWFCKADFLEYFFSDLLPEGEFVLFSHNSDREIGNEFRRHLDRRSLVAWFAQNPTLSHSKLRAVPIGIANPRWPHGEQSELRRVQTELPPKRRLFDATFNVSTNVDERNYCLEQTGLSPDPQLPFGDYLRRLASSYFCISPRGNGIDTHRTWEALYVGVVPVVIRSLVTEHHADLPFVVLDDWSEFRSIDFSPALYEQLMGEWTPQELRLDRYLERIKEAIGRLRR